MPGIDRFYSDHFQNTPNIKTSFSHAVRGRPCQFRFRWRQVKFWNRFIGLPQRILAYEALQVAFEHFQQQFIH